MRRQVFSLLFGLAVAFLPQPALAGDIKARTNLPRGTVLTAQDIELTGPNQKEAALELTDLLGKELRRTIRAGSVITRASVQDHTVVKRNDRVKMIYRFGLMEITAWGRAMDEGAPGEVISVINLESRKQVMGRVTDSGEVEVGI